MIIPKRTLGSHQLHVMLRAAQSQYETSKSNRLSTIRHAREVGLTLAEIGTQIGMTETGVSKMLKRAVK